MKNTLTIILLFVCWNLFAQEYDKVDSIVKEYPSKIKIEDLARKINKDFKSEELIARAIFTWISTNVEYDLKKYSKFKKHKLKNKKSKNQFQYEKSISNKTIRKKKGICGDYAVLYKYLCDLTGIECKVISGYSKTINKDIGKRFGEKHAWNTVSINGNWKLIDVTWGAGYVDNIANRFVYKFNDYYFFTNPELFFLHHFPRKTNYLFVEKTKDDFKNLPLYGKNYNYLNFKTEKSQNGLILMENDTINFEFKNSHAVSKISYKFGKEKFGKSVIPEIKGDDFTFNIEYRKRKTDYLNIYFNNRLYAVYKVKRI